MDKEKERRKFERIKKHFVLTYKVRGKEEKYEVSQIKNISEGGMLFTTSKDFLPQTILEIGLKTPISAKNINLITKVIESQTAVEGLIYNTRVSFIEVDEESKLMIKETVDFFLKKMGED
ncbi:MAG: PilZ domain-containing protein [Candidatus Omnitrophota bacterium]